MNEVLIVGHAASGLLEVETLLTQYGMSRARVSKKDGLHPNEITETICKAHGIDLSEESKSTGFSQIEVGPLWNNLALDLLMANVSQKTWGWADPRNIYLLDYWRKLEPRMVFFLVYDKPTRLLDDPSFLDVTTSSELFDHLNNWVAYNDSLLRFFLRYSDRCLLVHSKQVSKTLDSYFDQIRNRLGGGLHVPHAKELSDRLPSSTGMDFFNFSSELIKNQGIVDSFSSQELASLRQVKSERYLIDEIIKSHSQSSKLYAQLQSAANFPLEEGNSVGSAANEAVDVWLELRQSRKAYRQIFSSIGEYCSKLTTNVREKEEEILELQVALKEKTIEIQDKDQKQIKLFVDYELANKKAEQFSAEIGEIKLTLDRRSTSLNQAQLRIEDLERQLESTNKKNDDPLSKAKAELLLAQIHQLQEELDLRSRTAVAITSTIPETPLRKGAADRVKQDLPYRLGSLLVKQGPSIKLPWMIARETQKFWEQQSVSQLPSLSDFSDKHEAERVKQHLSYRLGVILAQRGSSPLAWFGLPFSLLKERRRFLQDRKLTGNKRK